MTNSGRKCLLGTSALVLAFSAAVLAINGCQESEADIARKPDLVNSLIDKSAAQAEQAHIHDRFYDARLRTILSRARAEDLKTLRDCDVTICLDHRLSEQKTTFWGRRIDAVFYNEPGNRTLALWDDGTAYEDTSIWTLDAFDYANEAIAKLAAQLRSGADLPPTMYAALYSYPVGKTTQHTTRWEAEKDFNRTSLSDNPRLRAAPIRAAGDVDGLNPVAPLSIPALPAP